MKDCREAAVAVLESKGYIVTDISSGSGVPKNSRLQLELGGKIERAVVKFANKEGTGRISFPRDGLGGFKVLSEVDLVIYVRPKTNTACEVIMFKGETIQRAFLETQRLLEGEGNENYEIWLSPDKENGTRFHGSGYRNSALWSLVHDNAVRPKSSSQTNLLDELKGIAAARLSLDPDKITIEVKITG